MTNVIVKVGSNLNNVTGAGTDYTIDWNGAEVDPDGVWSSNNLVLYFNTFVLINAYLKLEGLSALNGVLSVTLNTSDGDIPILTNNPTPGLISGAYELNVSRIFWLNPNNTAAYTANLKIKISGGLTNTVDIIEGSTFALTFLS